MYRVKRYFKMIGLHSIWQLNYPKSGLCHHSLISIRYVEDMEEIRCATPWIAFMFKL